MDRPEETELVDISEVSEVLEKEEPQKALAEPEIYLERRSAIASLRERMSAFVVDNIIFFYAYFLIGTIARRAFYGSWDGPLPSYGWQGLAFNGAFIFFVFMYYFIFEGVVFTTPGKFLSWMYVRQKDGSYPAMSSVFVRNVFRFVDYAFPPIPFFCMELTRRCQRLGDIIAGTTVIKKRPSMAVQYSITTDNIVSASGRVASSLIDLILVGMLTFGYLLFLSPEYPGLSRWLLLFSPIIPLLYFVITEPLTHTSPGKWIFGYTICQEDGSGVSFSGSLTRSIMRLLDFNPAGLAAMWLSSRRQRFGDLAADTIVTAQKRRMHGLIALAGWFAISGSILWMGLQNKESFIRPGFKFNFMPALEVMGSLTEDSGYKELTLTHIRLAAGDASKIRTPAVFKPGESVLIISDVYGYERSGRMVWMQEDLDVRYPDLSIGLHQENIIDFHQVLSRAGPVELTNNIRLPETAQAGIYTVTITVRDLFAHENTSVKQTFEVRAPEAN